MHSSPSVGFSSLTSVSRFSEVTMFAKHTLLGLGAVGAALILAGTAKAVTLDQLITGVLFVVGISVFSNFTLCGTSHVSEVLVTSCSAGLAFSNYTAAWTTPSGSSVISYDINITGSMIQTVGLDFTATATGAPSLPSAKPSPTPPTTKTTPLQVNVSAGGNTGRHLRQRHPRPRHRLPSRRQIHRRRHRRHRLRVHHARRQHLHPHRRRNSPRRA